MSTEYRFAIVSRIRETGCVSGSSPSPRRHEIPATGASDRGRRQGTATGDGDRGRRQGPATGDGDVIRGSGPLRSRSGSAAPAGAFGHAVVHGSAAVARLVRGDGGGGD
jgi:hypothetical protein